MKIAAIICNTALLAFTGGVLLTDGFPTLAAYVVFNVWLLATLILNLAVISRIGAGDGPLRLRSRRRGLEQRADVVARPSASTGLRVVAAVCNLVLLGLTAWAYADQYPHPEEPGFTAFTVLMVLTPIVSLAALVRGGATARVRRPDL